MECIEFLHEHSENARSNAKRIKCKIQDIVSNLQEEKINIDTFIVLCLMHEINTIILTKHFLFDRILWDIGHETPKKNCFIKQSMKNGEYVNEYEVYLKNILDAHAEVNDFYRKLCDNKLKLPLKVDSLSKPIKNISYYKKDDLIRICTKFNIDTMKDAKKTKNKKDLYQSILEVI